MSTAVIDSPALMLVADAPKENQSPALPVRVVEYTLRGQPMWQLEYEAILPINGGKTISCRHDVGPVGTDPRTGHVNPLGWAVMQLVRHYEQVQAELDTYRARIADLEQQLAHKKIADPPGTSEIDSPNPNPRTLRKK